MDLATTTYRVQKATGRKARRGAKYLRQRLTGYTGPTDPLFVVGCQRSGTNMLLQVLDHSLDTWVYNEDHPAAFDHYRLREVAVRRRLLDQARCRWVVFKPLTDSQHTAALLDEHPGSRAVWIFRRYQDASNSAAHKWGRGQFKLIRNLATIEHWPHWLAEKMPPERLALVRDLYTPEMTTHTAAALKWYLRNALFFDQELQHRPEVVDLLRYEDLVSAPGTLFPALFHDLQIPFHPDYIAGVTPASIGKYPFPEIEPAVQQLCEAMTAQLLDAYAQMPAPADSPTTA